MTTRSTCTLKAHKNLHRRADLPCPPMHARSPLTTAARRRRKSYDRSSLRQSAHLTQRSVLKDLGIVGNERKLSCQYIHTLILIRNVAPEFVSDSCQSGTTNGILYLYIMHVDQLQMRSKLKEVTAAANNRNIFGVGCHFSSTFKVCLSGMDAQSY